MKNNLTLLFILIFCTSFISENIEETLIRPNKDYALFFAIEDYDHWQDLRNPISDATSIAMELESNYGFQTEIIKNPTRLGIIEKLKEYREKTYEEDDQLLVFFTGHGEYTEETKEGFFVPKEGKLIDPHQLSYMAHSRLEKSIASIPCDHILLAIDACFSGTFDELLALSKGNRPGENENQRQNFIDRILKYKSRLYVTSGGKVRTPDQSQFAKQFLAALRGFGGADKIVSFSELVTHLQVAKPPPQNGQFGQNEIGSDFLFILTDESKAPKSYDRLEDLAAWEKASDENTTSSFHLYLKEYPNGIFAIQSEQNIKKIEEETDWKIAQAMGTSVAYDDYFKKYPNGIYASQAKQKSKEIEEETDWTNAEAIGTSNAYDDYLEKYPNGIYVSTAKQKSKEIEEKTDWTNAEAIGTSAAYDDYLEKYPNGVYAFTARQKSKEIEEKTDWTNAEAIGTSNAYIDFLKKYPSGKYSKLAKKKQFKGSSGNFIDSRDGKMYRWVKMKDSKIWMADNLNYETSGSYCYDNNEGYCNRYGRLYLWENAKKACPDGWHLPTDIEWKKMIKYYGLYSAKDEKKERGSRAFNQVKAYNELKKSGLNLSFGGARYRDKLFYDRNTIGYFWSITALDATLIRGYAYDKNKRNVIRHRYGKTNALSCKCVKD